MSNEIKQTLERLEGHAEVVLPAFFYDLNKTDAKELDSWVAAVIARERAGLDKLFDAMTHTFKYIPNFILVAITNKYIEAPIAARITEKLSLKQAVAIATGLSVDYVGETALYLDRSFAAELLEALPKKQAKKIVEFLAQEHPMIVLDVFAYADDSLFRLVKPFPELEQLDYADLSDARKSVLARFK